MKRLLLLGSGHAHLQLVRALARRPLPGVRMAWVAAAPLQVYSGRVAALVAGRAARSDVEVPLEPLARAAGIELVPGRPATLDLARHTVLLADGRQAEYDALCIGPGPGVDREAIPGAREHALFVRPIEHFAELLAGVMDLVGRQAVQVVVIGGGPAGFELALAFAERLARDGRPGSRVSLASGAEGLLPGWTAAARARAQQVLRAAAVTLLPEHCTAVEAGHVRLANGARVACDVPIACLGAAPPPWLAGSALARDAAGFVATAPTLQSLSHPAVFAAGADALHAGDLLAVNLACYLGGQPLQAARHDVPAWRLLDSGHGRALLQWRGLVAEGRLPGLLKAWRDRHVLAGWRPPAAIPGARTSG